MTAEPSRPIIRRELQITSEMLDFMRRLLHWDGVATPQDIGPQTTQTENSTRQRCKRNGLVTFDRFYWRLTVKGRTVMKDIYK